VAPGRGPHRHEHHGDAGGRATDEAFWDARYASSSELWSGNPNPQLTAEVVDLVPGTALDVGCGEGADAIWLARRGWRVTALDISTVALARGAARAAEASHDIAERITWLHADVTAWAPEATYQLVSVQFMHLPSEQRDSVFRRLAACVAPGGSLLVVGHHPSDLQTTARRPRTPGLLFTAADVAASLDPQEWVIVVSEARERGAVDPEGHGVTVHDTVLRAERNREQAPLGRP
jgi:SAM-dependent methyltransferase